MKHVKLWLVASVALLMSAFSFAQAPPNLFGAVTWNCRARQFAPTLAYRGEEIQGLFNRWNVDTIVFAGATSQNSFAGAAAGKWVPLIRDRADVFFGVAYVGDLQNSLQKMKFDVRLTAALEFRVGSPPTASKKTVYIGQDRLYLEYVRGLLRMSL